MEHGSTLGTWLAYGLIVLFLAVVVTLFARTVLLWSLLLLEPVRQLWTWAARTRDAGDANDDSRNR